MIHSDFTEVFRGGAFRDGDRRIDVALHSLGVVDVTSGKILACDPLSAFRLAPFPRRVPAGSYPVEVAVASYPMTAVAGRRGRGGLDRRVAAARVQLAPGTPARWRPAAPRGYGVDAGTGCFADARATKTLRSETVQAELAAALQTHHVPTWSWAAQPGLVAFSSGWGDGSYTSYWGESRTGKLLALATDFGVLLGRDEVAVELAAGGPYDDARLRDLGATVERVKSARAGVIALAIRCDRAIELAGAARTEIAIGARGARRHRVELAPGATLRVTVVRDVFPLPRARVSGRA